MADDLTELLERIEFNRTQIEFFKKQLDSFLCDSQDQWKEANADGTYNLFFKPTKPLPISIRSMAGMITNDLRTILDALACVLAVRQGAKDLSNVYFPISKSKFIFEIDAPKKMRELSKKDQNKISDFFPYKGGNKELWLLHSLDRNRKHQKLATGVISWSELNLGNGIFIRGQVENIKFEDCMIGGVPVRNISIGADGIIFSEMGKSYAAVTGVPHELLYQIRLGICYASETDFYGKDVLASLIESCAIVESVVGSFA